MFIRSRLRQLLSVRPRTLVRTLILLLAAVASVSRSEAAAPDVTFAPVPEVEGFPDATAAGAIQYACGTEEALASLYVEKGLRFNPALLRPLGEHPACHVYYEPTLPGFQISTEQQSVDELYVSLDSLSIVASRQAIGDSASIAGDVLARLTRKPRVTIGVSGGFGPAISSSAARAHFPGLGPLMTLRPSELVVPHLWGQDHLKSGELGGQVRLLVTRRLFEGRSSDGEVFRPLLDGLTGERYVRSKLSWEGGDLMAIALPGLRPARTMLVHGLAAARYWGASLDRREYAWVLRTEFGADSSIDVGGLAPHADYVVSFLPNTSIAIVAQPRFKDPALVGAAAGLLEELLGEVELKETRELLTWIRDRGDELFDDTETFREKLALARSEQFEPAPSPALEAELDAYLGRHCPEDPESCFLGVGKLTMLQEDPDLLRRSLDYAASGKMAAEYFPRLLNLMEGQIPGAVGKDPSDFDAVAGRLASLGFRVERLPMFLAKPAAEGEDPWPGVSYVNMLAVDHQVALPALGLGDVETAIAQGLAESLGSPFEVSLVDAKSALASNGGVHCVFGVIRTPRQGPIAPVVN